MAGILLAASACSTGEGNRKPSTEIAVKTRTVGYAENGTDKEYVGVIEEEMSAAVSFPVLGTIDRIYVSEGQRVAKGALLAELNAHNLTSMHTAASAMLKQAEDAMERIQMLYDNESLAEIKYIEMQTDLEKARSAEAIARKNLEDSRLVAPFSGIIGRKTAEAGENVLPNQAVLTVLRIDDVKVKVSVPEKEVNAVALRQPASIRVSALDGETFAGSVAEKGVVADPISHTYTIRLAVDSPSGRLLPGMVCNVVLAGDDGEQAIIIPNRCVQKTPDGETFVWTVADGHAVKNVVRTGKQVTGGVEVFGGLSAGDEIITEGYQKVSDGLKVTVL